MIAFVMYKHMLRGDITNECSARVECEAQPQSPANNNWKVKKVLFGHFYPKNNTVFNICTFQGDLRSASARTVCTSERAVQRFLLILLTPVNANKRCMGKVTLQKPAYLIISDQSIQ